jgi:glycosyltransferase involved in cell wall biosynthesis
VLAQRPVQEIVIVDDASSDGTWKVLQTLRDPRVKLVQHERNQGKGAALRTGIVHATAAIVLIQDADLEYDPTEYHLLLRPILSNQADVVFGSRFLGGSHRVLYFWHSIGNKLLTLLSNMATNLNLSDMETCYKVFRREVIQQIRIEEDRFGFEPEITAKVSCLKNIRIYEVPISYYGRTYAEGKKIGWRDGFSALRCIFKYNFLRRHDR